MSSQQRNRLQIFVLKCACLLTSWLTRRLERLLALSGITLPQAPLGLKALRVAPRTAVGIASGRCKQPTGLFVQTLKVGVSGDGEALMVANVYPKPTLEQLNQLKQMGELVYSKLKEPGYPEVVAVNTGSGVLPW